MRELLRRFHTLVADPYQSVAAEKTENPEKKVVGLFPMYIPEELVHAAGMLPVLMWESNEPITVAHSHCTPYNCALSRSVIDDAIKGKLDIMDGMVSYATCLQAKGLPFVIERNAPRDFYEIVYIPGIIDPQKHGTVRPYLVESFELLKESLGKLAGRQISDDALGRSIQVYNKNRSLLRRVYEIRRRAPELLRARDMVALVWSSMLMPKEKHNELLEKLLRELERQEGGTSGRADGNKLKLFLAGHMCFAPRSAILDMIEDTGACIVDDDLFTGWKYIANDVSESGSPVEALAARYLLREPPCPTKVDWDTHWGEVLARRAQQSGARGVVQLLVKFCPPHLTYYPDAKRKLDSYGLPEILVETEHELTNLEQARTRLQAFVETFA